MLYVIFGASLLAFVAAIAIARKAVIQPDYRKAAASSLDAAA